MTNTTQQHQSTRNELDATLGLVPVVLGGPSTRRTGTHRPRRSFLGLGAGPRPARGAAYQPRPDAGRFSAPR